MELEEGEKGKRKSVNNIVKPNICEGRGYNNIY
jgi:hypothetical protein